MGNESLRQTSSTRNRATCPQEMPSPAGEATLLSLPTLVSTSGLRTVMFHSPLLADA